MRPLLLTSTVLAGLVLAGAVPAQEYKLPTDPPPNPGKVVPNQRLEVADQNLVYAADRLDEAAQQGDQKAVSEAIGQSQQTIEQIRNIFQGLPQDQRVPYEDALLRAEQALAKGDPKLGATAMRELRQKMLANVAGQK
jgi:hypothetical protein